ncbi:MAG: cysteine desulfurase family protein, partial [Verrucomicrobiota bacterium]
TSGATESNNLALKGAWEGRASRVWQVITVATEHRSVLDPCRALVLRGAQLTVLPVGPDGLLDLVLLGDALAAGPALVSVMHANNETGVVQPVAEIARLAHVHGAWVHCDAVQSAGWLRVPAGCQGPDLISLSAHKLHGPKGVGALCVRRRAGGPRLAPQIEGGGQERGLRSGTLNVPGIVGLGEACRIAREERDRDAAQVAGLRNRLLDRLRAGLGPVRVNGSMQARLPNNLSVSFAGVDGEELVAGLGDVAVSRGSACSSARREPSHVLKALGLDDELAQATLRFGLGRGTTDEEIEWVAGRVVEVVGRLREAR